MSRCIAGGVQVVGRRKRLLHAQPATSASVDTTQDIQEFKFDFEAEGEDCPSVCGLLSSALPSSA